MVETTTVIQHNLGRGRIATGELLRYCYSRKASVLLLQEPATIRPHLVCGLGAASNWILVGSTTMPPLACIVLTDPSFDVFQLSRFDTPYYVCAHVHTATSQFYVVSIYLAPNIDVTPHIHHLRQIARAVRNAKLVVGGDLNAVSHLWSNRRPNPRGLQLEDFIA